MMTTEKTAEEKALDLALEGLGHERIMAATGLKERTARNIVERAKGIKMAQAMAAAAPVAPVEPAKPVNREDWLNRVAERMAPWFAEVGAPLTKFRVSVGFPSAGKKGKAIGECWTDKASEDAHHEIFIRPDRSDSVDVAAILCHELVHAAIGIDKGHGKAFKNVATALGLEGKMKATVPGRYFIDRIAPVIEELGPIPHGRLGLGESSGPKKQSTRMIKCECSECGYVVRTSKKWIELAVPNCPNPECANSGEAMTADLPEEEDGGDESGDEE
jgi:hypothetical protein